MKVNGLQLENEKLKKKLEKTQKNFEENNIEQIERIKNLFKDSDIVKMMKRK